MERGADGAGRGGAGHLFPDRHSERMGLQPKESGIWACVTSIEGRGLEVGSESFRKWCLYSRESITNIRLIVSATLLCCEDLRSKYKSGHLELVRLGSHG